MKEITHFILTRYNVGLYENFSRKDADRWMENREFFFKKFYLKGIKNQKNKNFKVLLQFSKYTDFNKVEYIFDNKHIIPIVIDFKSYILSYIRDNYKKYLITSRCDNDDLLLPNYVEDIQAQINLCKKRLLVDFIPLKYYENNYYTYNRPHCNSPFLSVIEKEQNIGEIIVTDKQHTHMPKIIRDSKKIQSYGAVTVIHKNNIINNISNSDKLIGDNFYQ